MKSLTSKTTCPTNGKAPTTSLETATQPSKHATQGKATSSAIGSTVKTKFTGRNSNPKPKPHPGEVPT